MKKQKKYSVIVTALFIAWQGLYGQSSFIPQNLGRSVNSVYSDINPVISPDGKTLYFVRVNHPENTYGEGDSEDIWYSEVQADGSWSVAQRIPELNVGRYNAILSLSPDGKIALINGIYNRQGTFWKKRGLSLVTKNELGWSTPEKLKVAKLSKYNRGVKSSGMISDDGKYLVMSFSRTYNSKKTNLFYSVQKGNGKYKKPRPIKDLNSSRNEDTPFLQADNKTFYFSSDYHEKGQYDIYKTTRTTDRWKRWTEPIKLSDTINSRGWEGYFKTNVKGSWAYFSSTQDALGGADIYKVKLFEENPFVVVSGKIIHAKSKKPLIGKAAKLMANGRPVDSVTFNPDSATYRVKLPLRKFYSLTAKVESYKAISAKIDVMNTREYSIIKQDLLEEPVPYVLLTGKLLSRGSNQPIPYNTRPRIYLNGVPADSVAFIDPATGNYTLKVNHGATYKIMVKANRFEPLPTTLDLSTIDDYQEISMNLFANEESVATVTGKIIDKKTSKPVSPSVHVSMRVEGMTTVWATIDTLSGTYDLKLPVGANYTISANAQGYYPLYETLDIRQERGNVKIFKDLTIVPIEVGQSIRLNNIFFQTGKATLKTESFPELDRVAQFLRDNPEIKIEIGGHTDNVGKAVTNLKLSEARARSVANYIISKGIRKDNIVSKGYGFSKPVASNQTAVGKAQNRRVEFTILDK
jgi:outer membrane protein OmpA-like peptidoglycan-associated protein